MVFPIIELGLVIGLRVNLVFVLTVEATQVPQIVEPTTHILPTRCDYKPLTAWETVTQRANMILAGVSGTCPLCLLCELYLIRGAKPAVTLSTRFFSPL